jgi:hypothetical protein
MEAGEDLGEFGDVPGDGVQVRAVLPGAGQFRLLVVIKVVRVGGDPPGQVTGFGRAGDGGRGGSRLAERQHVVADGAVAALVPAFLQLGVQLDDVGASLVPPLVQVGLVLVQDRRAAVLHLGQQLIDGFRIVEAADGLFREAGLAFDRLDALALGFQRLDQVVPLPGAERERRLLSTAGGGLDRGLLQVTDLWCLGDRRLSRLFGGGLFQAGAVPDRRLVHVLAQVVVNVPPVRDLVRVGCALPGAVGVRARAVTADHLYPGMGLQPVRDGIGLAVAEQVNGPAGLHVDDDGAVVPAPPEREVVDPDDRQGAGFGVGQRHDQAQHACPAGRQAQLGGEPGAGAAGHGQADRGQHPGQRRRPPCPGRRQALELLSEGHRFTVIIAAEEPAHPEQEHHRPPADRRVGQPPPVPAVHP